MTGANGSTTILPRESISPGGSAASLDATVPGGSTPPATRGKRFSLVPVTPEHHWAIYQMTLSEEVNFRWRYHGAVPTWETFESTLNANVLVQFLVVANQDPKVPVGMVVAYNSNLQDGTAHIATMGARKAGAGILEGFILMAGYLFDVWPLRKLYAETPEFNVSQFASAIDLGYLHEEGRLLGHRYFKGKYWDHITYAIYRDDYLNFSQAHPGLMSRE